MMMMKKAREAKPQSVSTTHQQKLSLSLSRTFYKCEISPLFTLLVHQMSVYVTSESIRADYLNP